MALYRVNISFQQTIAAPVKLPARRSYFIGGGGSTIKHRPTVPVAGIKSIEDFSGKVVETKPVKVSTVILTHKRDVLNLGYGHMRIIWLCRRREVVA